MDQPFEFCTAGRVIVGSGTIRRLPELAAGLGRQALVVTGRHPERIQPHLAGLAERGISFVLFPVSGEPTLDTVTSGTERARTHSCDMVVAVGGGSALDAGKAIAALLANGGEPLDYLEGIGRGRPITRPAAPCIAVPTTSGTGSEVTRNAVLGSPEHRVKVSMRSHLMLPRIALVDPELTITVPPALTAATGLDAFSQLLEAFVSRNANPVTDALCRAGLSRAAGALRAAFGNGRNLAARESMALASLYSGMALANAGLGAIHGMAGPLGGMVSAPHGALCARFLPLVTAMNTRALRARAPKAPALQRLTEVAAIVTGHPTARVEDGLAWLETLCRELAVPPLAAYDVTADLFPEALAKARVSSSMRGNPLDLTDDELREILEKAL